MGVARSAKKEIFPLILSGKIALRWFQVSEALTCGLSPQPTVGAANEI
jgi:hypothetical protein